jgi:lipoyl(octanoyl) transferase
MAVDMVNNAERTSALEAFLLGSVPYEDCLALQQRLVFEMSGRDDGQIGLLICEHPPVVSVGRQGSWAHFRCSRQELSRRGIDVHWVNRGGGCVLHAPGQLAIYPIVPLGWHEFTLGEYLDRLRSGIAGVLSELSIQATHQSNRHGLSTRNGHVMTVGVAAKHDTTYHGAYLNVDPPLRLLELVDSDPLAHSRPSSLAAQRRQKVKMTTVRESVIRNLSEAFGCDRYHLYTGHPLLRLPEPVRRGAAVHVG